MPTCRRRKRLSAATTVAAASTLLAIAPLGTRGFTGLSLFSRLRATNSITGRLSSARSLRRLDLLGDISMRRSLPMTGASSEASGFHGRRVVSTCADDDNSGNGGLGGWGWAVSRRVRSRKACLMSMENSSGNEERRQQPKPSHNYGTPRGITGTGVDRGNAPDLPALVVGVGLLVARHRRQQRANHERRQFAKRGPLVTTEDEEDMAMSVPGMGLAGAGLASKRTPGGRKGAFRKVEDDDKDGSVSAFLEEADSYVAESELLEGKGRENKGNYGEEEYDETASQGELAEEEQQHSSRADMDSETASIFPSHGEVTALEVSLDRPVLPEPVSPFLVFGTATVTCLGGIAVLARIPRMFEGVSSALRSMASQTMNPSNSERKLVPVFGDLRYNARLWAGSMRAWGDQRVEAWRRTFASEEVRLPVNDWSVCTLVERNVVGGNVLRYRFRLEGSPDSVLPLELGQALTLCGLDSSNKVLHGSYVPLSPRRQRGYFDVVVKRGSKGIDDGLDTTRSDKAFSHFLDKLPIGDELAVRPGREGLVYRGPYSPITDLVLIATGLGVVPMIQMVKELLPSGDSSVSTASVIWLNEKAEDFVLYGELEKVFFRNHRKLDVTCIVERDLYGHQLAANPSVREAAPDFKIGTLAAIAGPEFFTRKVTDFLVHKGYPEEVIIQL